MNISGARIDGTPKVGAKVKVEGYFGANGVFVVTKLEFQNSDSGGDDSVNDNGSKDDGSDDNSNDNSHEDDGGNDHEEDNSNSNESESSGGDG